MLMLNKANKEIKKRDDMIGELQNQLNQFLFLASLDPNFSKTISNQETLKVSKKSLKIHSQVNLSVKKNKTPKSSLLKQLIPCYLCPISNGKKKKKNKNKKIIKKKIF